MNESEIHLMQEIEAIQSYIVPVVRKCIDVYGVNRTYESFETVQDWLIVLMESKLSALTEEGDCKDANCFITDS